MAQPSSSTPPVEPPPGTPAQGEARFPRSIRVRDRREFQRIQGRGIRISVPHFLVMSMRQVGKPGPARLGITASRKTGESVQRARIKRLLREAFRQHKAEFPHGWDFVVIAREGSHTLTLDQVLAELRQALGKLKEPGAHARTGGRKEPSRGGRGPDPRQRPPGQKARPPAPQKPRNPSGT